MQYPRFTALVLTISCATTGLCQSEPTPAPDAYNKLNAIAERHVEAVNRSNSDSDAIMAISREGAKLLSELPLSDERKRQYLLEHIAAELLEMQKHEVLVRIMLRELAKQQVRTNELDALARFLKRQNIGTLDDTLFAYLITLEDQGAPVFFAALPTWGPMLKRKVDLPTATRSVLTHHILETAEREGWRPPSNSFLPAWTGNEEQEMALAGLERQRNLLALQYLEQRLATNASSHVAEPHGAANRSQPVSSETNRTSAAAGSGR